MLQTVTIEEKEIITSILLEGWEIPETGKRTRHSMEYDVGFKCISQNICINPTDKDVISYAYRQTEKITFIAGAVTTLNLGFEMVEILDGYGNRFLSCSGENDFFERENIYRPLKIIIGLNPSLPAALKLKTNFLTIQKYDKKKKIINVKDCHTVSILNKSETNITVPALEPLLCMAFIKNREHNSMTNQRMPRSFVNIVPLFSTEYAYASKDKLIADSNIDRLIYTSWAKFFTSTTNTQLQKYVDYCKEERYKFYSQYFKTQYNQYWFSDDPNYASYTLSLLTTVEHVTNKKNAPIYYDDDVEPSDDEKDNPKASTSGIKQDKQDKGKGPMKRKSSLYNSLCKRVKQSKPIINLTYDSDASTVSLPSLEDTKVALLSDSDDDDLPFVDVFADNVFDNLKDVARIEAAFAQIEHDRKLAEELQEEFNRGF